jgi:lactoylglutathione lyase
VAGRFRESFPILEVSDVVRSLGFYTELLGFRKTFSFDGPDGGPVYASLELDDGTKLAIGGPKEAVETDSVAIWLYTDEVDAAVSDLREAGVEVIAEPEDKPWGERVASVADPDGYTIHIGGSGAG